jgi:phosphate transport system permease protein
VSASLGQRPSVRRRARPTPHASSTHVALRDRIGDRVLGGLALVAALVACALIAEIGYQLIDGSRLSIATFGPSFIWGDEWKPNFDVFGALTMLYGTAVSALIGLVIATPVAIAIGLYLSLLAPRGVRGVVGGLVEMLAAIPSVILGFWGILVLAPFVHSHLEPWLHGHVGFLPVFGPVPATGLSLFTAGLILAIMCVPIIASISRDLFLTVPRDLQDGAAALGATRWEIVRGVVLPSTASGVASAACLGLGRALGEAIAVTQVVGSGTAIHASLFETGDTLAGKVANEFAGATTKLHTSSLFYLALILLAIGLATNLLAQWIARRFDVSRLQAR